MNHKVTATGPTENDRVIRLAKAYETTGTGNLQVAAEDGSPCREIEINEATSRVRAIRNAC